MKYSCGQVGRALVVRFDHQEDILTGIRDVILKEGIRAAIAFFVGAVEQAKMVTGPEELKLPPTPHWIEFADGREILGIATIFREHDEPKIHLHSAAGRDRSSFTGCMREWAKAFLIVECIILEITQTDAKRKHDPQSGLSLLDMGGDGER